MRASFEQSARDLLYSYIGGYTPLVVDLDGDGAELTALGSTPFRFDMDNDGFAEYTGWLKGEDAILFALPPINLLQNKSLPARLPHANAAVC